MPGSCFQCGASGSRLYGYTVCEKCKSGLGLFTDDTIRKHMARYKMSNKKRSYQEEVHERLYLLEVDTIKKRIKLLHIQARIKVLKSPDSRA